MTRAPADEGALGPSEIGRWLLGRLRLFGGALTALIVMVVYLTVTQPFFLTQANLENVMVSNSDLFLISIGMTFVLLSGGFDLSAGAVAAGSGLLVYYLSDAGLPILAVILLPLVASMLFGGLTNGVLVGKAGLNFFVVTLGTSSILTGVIQVKTNGSTMMVNQGDSLLYDIGNGTLWGLPVPVWICAGVAVLGILLLTQTPLGRAIYAVGGNREAARLAGINVVLVLILVYAISALCAGTAGVVAVSRLGAASPQIAATLPLIAAAAVLLGGTSFTGGIGGIGGTIVGVLLIAVLQNGLGLMGVSSYWQGIVTGVVLIVAVAIDRLQRRSRR